MAKKSAGKRYLMDYDAAAECDDCRRVYFLSERTVVLLEQQCEYLGWVARYYSNTDAEVVLGTIEEWAATAIQELQQPGMYQGEFCLDASLCDLLSDCITSGGWDDILRDWVKENTDVSIKHTTPDAPEATENVVSSCDPDLLFGAVTQVIDLLNSMVIDLLQKLVNSTNWSEQLQVVIGAIPIVETLPIDEFVGMVHLLADQVLNSYYAAYDEDVRTQYRCDLFCAALDDCTLSLWDMCEYFASEAEISVSEIDFTDLVEYLSQGVWSGVELVHIMHALFTFILCMGEKVLGLNGGLFNRLFAAMFNDPNNDWEVLCDCVSAWEYDLDLTAIAELPAFVSVEVGEFIVGSGIRTTWNDPSTIANIRFTTPEGSGGFILGDVTGYWAGWVRGQGSDNITGYIVQGNDADDVYFGGGAILFSGMSGAGSQGYSPDKSNPKFVQVVLASSYGNNPVGDGYITRVVLSGTGINPYGE